MADWYGTARSNYFKVKRPEVFKVWAETRGLTLLESNLNKGFAITAQICEHGAWPNYFTDEDTGEDIEFNIYTELATYLKNGQIAVLMEAGAEKQRYVTGDAIAIHSDGRMTALCLNDIYKQAARKFKVEISSISMAQY